MELTEDENIKQYGKHCGHCGRKMLLPYEYEWSCISCISCGFNLVKRKHEFTELQRKKTNFINRLKYAEHKNLCICPDVYKNYEGGDFDKICEVLSTLKKLKLNNILFDKYKDKLDNSDFEQDLSSRTSSGIYKIGHHSIRLKKRLALYDRSYYENINYYDMKGSILKYLNEISS